MKKGKTLYQVFEEEEKRKAPASTGARENQMKTRMSDRAHDWLTLQDRYLYLLLSDARRGVKLDDNENPATARAASLEVMRLVKEATK